MADWFFEWLDRGGVEEPLTIAPILRQPLTLVGLALLAALGGLAVILVVSVVLAVWALGVAVLNPAVGTAWAAPSNVSGWITNGAIIGAALGGAWGISSWTAAVFRPLREKPFVRGLAVWTHSFAAFLLVQVAWVSFAWLQLAPATSLTSVGLAAPAPFPALWALCALLFLVVTGSAYWTYAAWGKPVSYRTRLPAGGGAGGGVLVPSEEAASTLDNTATSTTAPRGLQVVTNPQVSYKDLVGMEDTKRELLEAIKLMRDPATMERHGLDPVRGILLHGPPGTGKTHFARATGGELGIKFLAVQSSDLVSKYVGETEHNIAAVFEYARRAGPAILFFDEFDALARDRSKAVNDWEVSRVNAILTEMDGLTKDKNRPIVLAATNRLDDLDAAFLRPGRFDRRVYVGLPDAAARRAMLKQFYKGRQLAAGFDGERIVHLTEGCSAAELQRLVKDVYMRIYRENPAMAPRALRTEDLVACLKARTGS